MAIELDPAALQWLDGAERAIAVVGDASDEAVTERAADAAQAAAPLAGWVNNAAVFRDASIDAVSTRELLDLINVNLALAVVGCATAVRRFLAAGTPGAIVNVTSHQARLAVPGCTPYVTAKAATEGLDPRARRRVRRARDPRQRRRPGSIVTSRFHEEYVAQAPQVAERIEREIAHLHPDRARRAPRGGRRRRRSPALRRGELHHRRHHPRGRRRTVVTHDPQP